MAIFLLHLAVLFSTFKREIDCVSVYVKVKHGKLS